MGLPIWKRIELNRSGRPTLLENEIEILIEDSVGLYQGKSKILNRQDGRVYLTSKRIIYIDNENLKTNSLAVSLNDVANVDFYAGFLKSSPKITIFFNSLNQSDTDSHSHTDRPIEAEWICSICSFINKIATNHKLSPTDIPRCQSCGMRAQMAQLKKAIESKLRPEEPTGQNSVSSEGFQCPRCTFINHPSMMSCEICGTDLISSNLPSQLRLNRQITEAEIKIDLETSDGIDDKVFVKLSFRNGGEKIFYDKLNDQLDKIKWKRLQDKGKVNSNAVSLTEPKFETKSHVDSGIGIHRLEQMGENKRKNNEIVLSSSLEDLEQLMAKAKDLLKLSESFANQLAQQNKNSFPLPNGTNNTVLGNLNKSQISTSDLYYKELSRTISEYLSIILPSEGGLISLIDFYALYNRSRGINLISPEELMKALKLLKELKLPFKLRQYKSGVIVIMHESNDETKIMTRILNYLIKEEEQFSKKLDQYTKLAQMGYQDDLEYDTFFKGRTLWEISDHFDWSSGVAQEEIELGVNNGLVTIDEQISGTFYFINKFLDYDWETPVPGKQEVNSTDHYQIDLGRFNLMEDVHSVEGSRPISRNTTRDQSNESSTRNSPPSANTPMTNTGSEQNSSVNLSLALQDLEGLKF